MAMPPTAAAAPPMAPDQMPPDDEATEAQSAPEDEGEVVATIMRMPDGTYSLTPGDEAEPNEPAEAGAAPAPEPQMFDTPQALIKGLMDLLNEGTGAEESFGKGFRGEPDAMAEKAPAKSPVM